MIPVKPNLVGSILGMLRSPCLLCIRSYNTIPVVSRSAAQAGSEPLRAQSMSGMLDIVQFNSLRSTIRIVGSCWNLTGVSAYEETPAKFQHNSTISYTFLYNKRNTFFMCVQLRALFSVNEVSSGNIVKCPFTYSPPTIRNGWHSPINTTQFEWTISTLLIKHVMHG